MKRQHQPRKRFGQHFLRSPQVLTQITQAIQPCSDEHFVEIGAGEQPVDWIAHLLSLKDRSKSAATAKPNGLYLVDVTYPDEFGLPKPPLGPLFLPDF